MKERLFEAQLPSVHFSIEVVVEVVENKQGPHVEDEDDGAEDHANDEQDPECPDWRYKIHSLNVDKYSASQGNTEEQVEHLEDDVGVDESVIFCSYAVDLAAGKDQI